MSDWGYTGLAYAVMWAVLVAYGVYLVRQDAVAADALRQATGKGGAE